MHTTFNGPIGITRSHMRCCMVRNKSVVYNQDRENSLDGQIVKCVKWGHIHLLKKMGCVPFIYLVIKEGD